MPLDATYPTDYTPWLICNPCFGTGFPISSLVKVSQGHFLYFCWDLGDTGHKPKPRGTSYLQGATTSPWICRPGRGKLVWLVWFLELLSSFLFLVVIFRPIKVGTLTLWAYPDFLIPGMPFMPTP